jgi:hypothetical protein
VNYRVLVGTLVHLATSAKRFKQDNSFLQIVCVYFGPISLESKKVWPLHFVNGFALTLRPTLAD